MAYLQSSKLAVLQHERDLDCPDCRSKKIVKETKITITLTTTVPNNSRWGVKDEHVLMGRQKRIIPQEDMKGMVRQNLWQQFNIWVCSFALKQMKLENEKREAGDDKKKLEAVQLEIDKCKIDQALWQQFLDSAKIDIIYDKEP